MAVAGRAIHVLCELVVCAVVFSACGDDGPADHQDLLDLDDANDALETGEQDEADPSDPVDEPDAVETGGTVALYDLSTPPLDLPFPYDYYTVADSSSPTGLRLALDDSDHSNAMIIGVFRLIPAAYEAFGTLEGFGPYGWFSVEIAGQAPLGWSQQPTESPDEDAPVHLLTWDGTQVTGEPPFGAYLQDYSEKDGTLRYFLDVLPLTPLPDASRYIVVVTTDLQDAQGEAIGPDSHFQVVAGLAPLPEDPVLAARLAAERDRLGPALDALESYGIDRGRLVVAFDATLAPARADMLAIGHRFTEEEGLSRVEYTFDPDGDEVDNLYRPGDPGFPSGASGSRIQLVAMGEFQRRDFRHPDVHGGTFLRDSDGIPLLHHLEPIAFWLALPDTPQAGPFPVVLLVHGLNSSRNGMWSLAVVLAEAGIASLSFDLPEHGSDGLGTQDFMPLDEPLLVRDNFRQAAIDVLGATYLVQTWVEEGLDLVPDPADGTPDLTSDRIGLLGHSLGSMVSITACALAREPGAGVYAAGGGGLVYFINAFLERFGLADLVSGSVLHGFNVATGHLLSLGDPLLYASYCHPAPLLWVDRSQQVLMVEMVDDEVIPDESIAATAIAMGLPHIEPVVLPVAPLEVVADEGQTSGLVQYGGGNHAFIFPGGQPAEMVPLVQGQMVHFLDSFLRTGQAEIIHPYPP